jgi:hypothetical protein
MPTARFAPAPLRCEIPNPGVHTSCFFPGVHANCFFPGVHTSCFFPGVHTSCFATSGDSPGIFSQLPLEKCLDPCQLAWQDPEFGKLAIGLIYPSAPISPPPAAKSGAEASFEVTIS